MQACVAPFVLPDELRLNGGPRRIGIFGGTFNPIHNGHLLIAQHAATEFALERIDFMVAADPPHKEGEAPAELRYEMVECALAPYPHLAANDLELHRSGPSYTVDTMRILHEREPDADFYFVLGEDSLYQIEGWHEIEKLAKLTKFICLRRPIDPQLIQPDLQAKIIESRYGAEIFVSEYRGPAVSSTMIRERLREGESIRGLVPKCVEEKIYDTGLYQR